MTTTTYEFDIAVVGEGVAGLSTTNFALQLGLRTATFEAENTGGLVAAVNALDPVPPGFPSAGIEWASDLALENLDRGVHSISGSVSSVGRDIDGGFALRVASDTLRARTVVIATGARHRALGIPGEIEFAGRGVSKCADCDGPLFRGQDVVVIGSGDSACQEALILAGYCTRVIILRRKASFRASSSFIERVRANPQIDVIDAVVDAILGDTVVRQVEVRPLGASRSHAIACAGVFPFVGLDPQVPLLPAEVRVGSAGHVVTDADRGTSLPGLWAVGAVREKFPGLLSDATADARLAARSIAVHFAKTPIAP